MSEAPQLQVCEDTHSNLYQDWQRQILAGNHYFENNDLEAAMACYRCGIAVAEELISESENFRMAIVSLIVSYHNLADVFMLQSEATLAEKVLNAIHNRVIELQSEYLQDIDKQESIMWGLRRTYSALLLHMKKHSKSKVVPLPQMPIVGAGQSNLMN